MVANYPANLVRVSFGGNINRDEDIWSNTFHMLPTGGATGAALKQHFDMGAFANAVTDLLFTNNGGPIAAGFIDFQWVKVALIGTDGKYTEDANIYYSQTPATSGANQTGRSPSDSLAVTLYTKKQRGRGARGRLFSVPMNWQLDPSGYVPQTDCAAIASKFSDIIAAANNATGADGKGEVVIASRIDGSHNPVTGVSVGSVQDVQRRRRNKLREKYPPVAPV